MEETKLESYIDQFFFKCFYGIKTSNQLNRHFPVIKAGSVGVIIMPQKNKKDCKIDSIEAGNENILEKNKPKIGDDEDVFKFANI